jgi:hypothetical protein
VHKKLLVFTTLALLTLSFFSANVAAVDSKDVVYVLEDQTIPSQNVLDVFNDLGFSYDIIRDSEITSTDFSQYSILFVQERVTNKQHLPLDNMPSVFLDNEIAEEKWSLISQGQTNHRNILVTKLDSFVFDGITIPTDKEVQVYTTVGTIHSVTPKTSEQAEIAAIRIGNPGPPTIAYTTNQNNGKMIKTLFFGAPEPDIWTANAQKIFENSLTWALSDVDQDEDGFIFSEDCNDQDPNINPDATEIPYDGIDQDCSGFDLLDVDEDGFCEQGEFITDAFFQCSQETSALGSDCNDNDPTINANNTDPTLNCINDAPEIINPPEILWFAEGDLAEFEISATDPESDPLTFSIDDPRFTVTDNHFEWQTEFSDAGTHNFEITVSDGDLTDTITLTIQISDENQPPTSLGIPDLEIEEDTTYTIYLSDYFEDPDSSPLSYEVHSLSENIQVILTGEEAEIIPDLNYNGPAWVIFTASDEFSTTQSNKANIQVTPVNDQPVFTGEIPGFEWNEDTNLDDAFNLNDYFNDIDSDLTFQVFGNTEISVIVNDNIVSFSSPADFAGQEEIYFRASDEEFSADSNTFILNVFEQGEHPVFEPLDCVTSINEDEEYTCILNATDVENNDLTYSVKSQENLLCEITVDVLTYKSSEDYNGNASCVLEVTDIHGKDSTTLEVEVLPINDAPKIISASPDSSVATIIEGRTQKFSIEAMDPESDDFDINWYLNNVLYENANLISASELLFDEGKGNYFLEARVSDSNAETRKFWNVIVGDISDFTCSEAGGKVCSEDHLCSGETLNTKDSSSNVCCATSCVPKFEDAGFCEEISPDLDIEINLPDSDDEYSTGKTERVSFRIHNKLDFDQDFEVEVHLYNVEDDQSVSEVKTDVDVDANSHYTLRLDLEIPEDLDLTKSYLVYVRADDYVCSQEYTDVKIIRPEHDVKITRLDLPESAECGESVRGRITVENFGKRDEGVELQLNSNALDFEEIYSLDLEEFGGSDRESESFDFIIPRNTKPGEYELKATAVYDISRRVTLSEKIEVSCFKETVLERETPPETNQEETVVLNQARQNTLTPTTQPSIWKNQDFMTVAFFMMLNFVLVASAGVLYLAHNRKYKRR